MRLLALLSLIRLSAANKSLIPSRYVAVKFQQSAVIHASEAETSRLRAAPEVIQQRLEETISQLEDDKMRSELKISLLELKIQELADSEGDARQSAQNAKAALERLRVSFDLL